jgi:hypothetical protein
VTLSYSILNHDAVHHTRAAPPLCLQGLEGDYAELAGQMAGSQVAVAKFQADTEREFAADKFGLKTFPTLVLLPKGGKGGEWRCWLAVDGVLGGCMQAPRGSGWHSCTKGDSASAAPLAFREE